MGEDARATGYRRLSAAGGGGSGDRGFNDIVHVDDGYQDRVIEWENGLPDCGDLTPLCQALVPPELASAFSIAPEPSRTVGDVALASRSTLSNIRGGASSQAFSTTDRHEIRALDGGEYERDEEDEDEEDGEEEDMVVDRLEDDGGGSKKLLRKSDLAEEADSVTDGSKTAKRQRLVWTPQLHKRFVDVVSHLRIKNAVPKTIMQLMNVEGLTRENVASHLQKYRLYLKRMQVGGGGGGSMIGNSDGGMGMAESSATDQLFASTPVPPRGVNNENGGGSGTEGSGGHAHAPSHRHNGAYGSYGNGEMVNGHMPMMMGYGMPVGMVGMPVYGMYGRGHPGMPVDGNNHHRHRYGAMVPNPPQSGASSDK